MINKRTQNIIEVISQFTGKDGEPSNDSESYILKSMWVMMLSEFEGSIKDMVESYIDKVKKRALRKSTFAYYYKIFILNLKSILP